MGHPRLHGRGRTDSDPITFAADVVVADAEVFNFTPVSPLTDADLAGLQAAINGGRHGLDVDGYAAVST